MEYAYCTNLKTLDVNENKMTGEIPVEYSRLSALEIFDTSENDFTGTMPKEICNRFATDVRKFIDADCDEVPCSCCQDCR